MPKPIVEDYEDIAGRLARLRGAQVRITLTAADLVSADLQRVLNTMIVPSVALRVKGRKPGWAG